MAYNPLGYIQNQNANDMLNVVLYHVWPQGQIAQSFSFGTVKAGVQSQACQLQSGSGPGFDYFTLTFNFANGAVMAMAPTVANLGANNTPSTTVIFGVEPDGEVSIQNSVYPDVTGHWAPVYTEGFLSAGVTNGDTDVANARSKDDVLASAHA